MGLQSDRVSSFKTAWRALGGLPPRRPAARGIMRRSRVESKSGDNSESVTVPRVNRDPFAWTAAAKGAEFFRAQRDAHEAGAGQRVGNRARTIVGVVVKCFVPAAEAIRFGAQLIRRPDGA